MSNTTQNGHDGGIRTTVSQNANKAYSYAQRSLDRVVPPSSRQNAYDSIAHYARTRPVLFVRRPLFPLPSIPVVE